MWTNVNTAIVLHAIGGGVLAGAAIHNAILAARSLGGGTPLPRLRRLYPRVILGAWILVMALGVYTYPSFRVEIREAFLDQSAPWAVWLFEIKEHGVALGMLLLIYLIPASRHLHPVETETETEARFYDLASLALGVVVCWATVVGLIVTTMRPL